MKIRSVVDLRMPTVRTPGELADASKMNGLLLVHFLILPESNFALDFCLLSFRFLFWYWNAHNAVLSFATLMNTCRLIRRDQEKKKTLFSDCTHIDESWLLVVSAFFWCVHALLNSIPSERPLAKSYPELVQTTSMFQPHTMYWWRVYFQAPFRIT